MPIIGGNSGPYSLNQAGSYGANVANQVLGMQTSQQGIKDLLSSSIQISRGPGNSPYHARNDYFGYAQREVQALDANRDSVVDEQELAKLFGGNTQEAQRHMQVLNQDGQAGLSVVDLAAQLYVQDGIGQLLQSNEHGDSNRLAAGRGILSDAQRRYEGMQQKHFPGEEVLKPGNLDGKVSVAENAAVAKLMQQDPELVAQMLRSTQQKLNLQQGYQEFARQQGAGLPQQQMLPQQQLVPQQSPQWGVPQQQRPQWGGPLQQPQQPQFSRPPQNYAPAPGGMQGMQQQQMAQVLMMLSQALNALMQMMGQQQGGPQFAQPGIPQAAPQFGGAPQGGLIAPQPRQFNFA